VVPRKRVHVNVARPPSNRNLSRERARAE
jgi:hypothetical protein